MPGRHAAPGQSEFLKGLTKFVLKGVLFGMILMLMFWVLIVKVPEWWPSESAATSSTVAATADGRTPTTPLPTTTSTFPERTVVTPNPTTTLADNGTPAPSTSSSTSASSTSTTVADGLLAPEDIEVRVMNSTGRGGLAARVTSELAALGYDMLTQGNMDSIATTTVYYIPGLAEEAEVLAAQLPGAVAVAVNPAGSPSADLLVVLGSSYP